MLETLKQTIVIDKTLSLNSIIYYLKKLPLIKNLLKKVGYEYNGLTTKFAIFVIAYSMIQSILIVMLLAALGVAGPLILLKRIDETVNPAAVWPYLFLCFFYIMPLCRSSIVEPSRRKFICIKVFKMDVKRYLIADILPKNILRFIVELIVYGYLADKVQLSLWITFLLISGKHAFFYAVEAIHLSYYVKHEEFLHKKTGYVFTMLLVPLVAGYIPLLFKHPILLPHACVVLVPIIGILAGIKGIDYLVHFSRYEVMINDANRMNELNWDKEQTRQSANFGQVKLKDKDLTIEKRSDLDKLSGYDYLNALFFQRHRRILFRPIIRQLYVIIGITVVAGAVLVIKPEYKASYLKFLSSRYPFFIYLLNMMSVGEKAAKAMFYNCDISLLRYGFYREKSAVLTTFSLRVGRIIMYNLVSAGAMAGCILVLNGIAGGNVYDCLLIVILILVISIFFSVYHIFMYYMCQPYTTEYGVKNPLFSVITRIVNILCFLCFQITSFPLYFLTITLVVTISFIIAALICVYRFAPKTFVIR